MRQYIKYEYILNDKYSVIVFLNGLIKYTSYIITLIYDLKFINNNLLVAFNYPITYLSMIYKLYLYYYILKII